jgi:hypothetical protein
MADQPEPGTTNTVCGGKGSGILDDIYMIYLWDRESSTSNHYMRPREGGERCSWGGLNVLDA